MNEINYIATENLYPHKDNPRKDLGDLSELADSIKANGILQNLTVVPCDESGNSFTVIIGHRRLAAAKLAGLSTVPCVIRDMSPQEQIKTMLVENIQRSELTPYEQAQGFQMMLDMGETVDTIAEKSGFSTTTVRRRVKLLDLDSAKFQESVSRGATLSDYAELDKIKSIELKNEVLESIGTNNFNNALRSAIEKEKDAEFVSDRIADVKAWAEEITDSKGYSYVTSYFLYSWTKDSVVEKPNDADTVKYFYAVSKAGVSIYKELIEVQETAEEISLRELKEAAERRRIELSNITKRHFELRRDFVHQLAHKQKYLDQHSAQICKFAANEIIGNGRFERNELNTEMLANLLEFEIDENMSYDDFRDLSVEKGQKEYSPIYLLLACAYAKQDDEKDNCYYSSHWDREKQINSYRYEPNDTLDSLYAFLVSIGYDISDEEKAMQNGAHELFEEEK